MTNPTITEISHDDFETEVHSHPSMVLVDFWAPYCHACRQLTPIIDELAVALEGRVRVVKCNVEDYLEAAKSYGVSSLPTLILFNGNDIKGQWVGVRSKEYLLDDIEAILNQSQ